jgi:hypothetical protein
VAVINESEKSTASHRLCQMQLRAVTIFKRFFPYQKESPASDILAG